MCFLSDNIYDYNNVSQGKITIPSMDDGEEFIATDVSAPDVGYNSQFIVAHFFNNFRKPSIS